MAIHYRRIADYLRSALAGRGLDELVRLRPRRDPSRPRVPGGSALLPQLTKETLAPLMVTPLAITLSAMARLVFNSSL